MTSNEVAITFEGRKVSARRGESLLAALMAAGEIGLRQTAGNEVRGAYCGMGACQECLVMIDGQSPERACMTKVERSMSVGRACDPVPWPVRSMALSPRRSDDMPLIEPRLLVIGAGPAGLAAATAASRAGIEVLMVDERSAPGGQYFKQLAIDDPTPGPDQQHTHGAKLIEAAHRAGVEIRLQTTVWGAFPGPEFAATDPAGTFRIRPASTIIATGAYERGWQVPGWTLPGVMTTGAAQSLWRTSRRLPGKRVLIAGNGPLNLHLATELLDGGAEVVALVEAAPAPGLSDIGAILEMAARAPGLVRDGVNFVLKLRKAGVAVRHGSWVKSIAQADDDDLSVEIDGDTPVRLSADIVCLGYGLLPSNELARALGCDFRPDVAAGHLVPARDPAGQSTVPGVFVIGDGVRLGGAQAAMSEGRLAGLEAARRTGARVDALEVEDARRSLAAHRRFQRNLWTLYAPARRLQPSTSPDTIICRCESVHLGDVDRAMAAGYSSAGAIKQQTRLGMGRCQGRYCSEALLRVLPERGDDHSGFAPRVPVRPVTIGDLAR